MRISGSGTALPLVQEVARAYDTQRGAPTIRFEPGTNTGGAIRGLLQGTMDVAVANRPLSDAEAREDLLVRPFARDAMAFAVTQPNPLQGLSTAQLQEVYGGAVTDWEQLGGPSGRIAVLDRDADESARKEVLLPFMAGRPIGARTIVLPLAAEMVRALEGTPHALGYSPVGLLRVLRAQNLQVLALDGVTPGPQALAAGTYPWFLTYTLVTRADAPVAVRRFVEFVLGSTGRRTLEALGVAALSA